jgi:hypothetical protein
MAAQLAMEAEENNKRHRTTTLGVESHKSQDVSHEAWVGLDLLEGGISSLSLDNDTHDLMGGIGNRGHGFPQGKGLLDDVDDAVSGGTAVGEEDDILGVLSKPVEVVITEKVFPLPFLYLFGFLLLFSREIGCKFA